MAETIRVRVVISGQVQGVFFRDTTCRRAQQRDVSGWVRNCADGSVEAVFEGARDAVESMVDFCREGPRGAHVERIETYDEAVESLTGFAIV